jgi:hypothetical protein
LTAEKFSQRRQGAKAQRKDKKKAKGQGERPGPLPSCLVHFVSLRLCSLASLREFLSFLWKNRGDRTAIELFLAGVRGWEGHLRQRLDDGNSQSD